MTMSGVPALAVPTISKFSFVCDGLIYDIPSGIVYIKQESPTDIMVEITDLTNIDYSSGSFGGYVSHRLINGMEMLRTLPGAGSDAYYDKGNDYDSIVSKQKDGYFDCVAVCYSREYTSCQNEPTCKLKCDIADLVMNACKMTYIGYCSDRCLGWKGGLVPFNNLLDPNNPVNLETNRNNVIFVD